MSKPTTKDQASEQQKAFTIEYVKDIFDEWEGERDRMFALLNSIETLLRPPPGEDSPEFNAWKLTQVASDLMGDVRALLHFKSRAGLSS